jgi:type VI secretion system protein ImpM
VARPFPRGLSGKLPSRGDFVTRGLPRSFLDPWEKWVGQAVAASRALLGDAWMDAWLTAPVWRFSLPPGACGPDPVLGLMLPSVDAVGRGYPLTVAVVFTGCRGAPDPEAGALFLDEAEDAARDALADDADPDDLAAWIADAVPVPEPDETGKGLWWTEGGPLVSAMSLVLDGLPPMPDHAAMLVGDAAAGGACP